MDVKPGARVPVSARWFDADGEVEDIDAEVAIYLKDQTTGARRYIQANAISATLGATRVTFPLDDFVANVGYDLAGGWIPPTVAVGAAVVIEKVPSDLERCDILTEEYNVQFVDLGDLADAISGANTPHMEFGPSV